MMSGFWSPEMDGYNPDNPVEQDLDMARELLEGTECEDGCELSLTFADAFSFAPQTAQIVQQNLAELGIDVQLSQVDVGTLFDDKYEGNFQIHIGGLISAINVPDLLISYGLPVPGGSGFNSNWSDWESERAEELGLRAVQSSGDERQQVLVEIDELYREEMPYITLHPYSRLVGQRYPESIVTWRGSYIQIAREDI